MDVVLRDLLLHSVNDLSSGVGDLESFNELSEIQGLCLDVTHLTERQSEKFMIG